MHLIDVLAQDHALLRSALQTVERHLGPEKSCGWEDRVKVDSLKFRRDLDVLFKALRAHESLEEKVAARWRPATEDSLKELLLARHKSIDSLRNLFTIAAALMFDGHVHATRTILSRLREEVTGHIDEEERDLFPSLKARAEARP